MTPEQLKASILQYVMMGKITSPQEKTKTVVLVDNEFEIPSNWEVCEMQKTSLKYANGNYAEKYPKSNELFDSGDVPFLRANNIKNGKVLNSELKYISSEKHEELQRGHLKTKDIIVAIRGDIGNCGIVPEEFDNANLNAQLTVVRVDETDKDKYNAKYLLYLFMSPIMKIQFKNYTTGTALKQLSEKNFHSCIVFIPPIDEQQKIVEKIEECLPFVDSYAKAYEKLEKFNAKFPEDMKKSILQYAIMGKLVEQRAEEGTAEELYQQIQEEKQKLIAEKKIKKEKSLAEITEDEIPFDIPEGWRWCRLSEVLDVRDGTHDSPKYVPEGIPLVTSKNLSNGIIDYSNVKYVTQEVADKINERSLVEDEDILFAMIGSIGNPVMVKKDREFCIKNMALFKRYENTNMYMKYIYWFLMKIQHELKAEASGGVQSFISLSRFREYLLPLPPLEEQKRIVAKIEELLPYCDQLIK